jgi:inner membrane protease subunit 1
LGIRRGALIVYTSPIDPTRTVCKRLVGLPGDIICVDPFPDPPASSSSDESQLDQNAPTSEDSGPLEKSEHGSSLPPHHIVVPPGHLWALGDNRSATRDSNTYGPVPFGLVHGQARAIVSVSTRSVDQIHDY